VVKFNVEGGVPHVLATLNGTSTQTMVFDSGASLVTLNADVARQLTLTAPAKETTVKLQDAKGTLTDAKIMILKSIRVGQYTVEDVECAVMPESSHGSNLLGGTFLRHFIYRMDLSSGELHLLPREAGRTKLTPTLPEIAKGTPPPALPPGAAPAPTGSRPTPPGAAGGPPKPGGSSQTPGQDAWLDLLDGVTQDHWKRDGSAIVSPVATNITRLLLPFTTQGSYEIEVEFNRLDEPTTPGGASITVPVGNVACQVALGEKLGTLVGFAKIDGKFAGLGPAKVTRPNLVLHGQPHTALVKVQLDGDAVVIDLTLDGNQILSWSGKQSSLSPGLYDPQSFSLNAWQAQVRYSKARIRSLSGELRRCQPVKKEKDKAKNDATDTPKAQG
jgi:clan AA aspartic protease (TIGR02281 family)